MIIICFLAVMGQQAFAQGITFGPRFGLISSDLNLKDNAAQVKEGDAEFGYQFGVMFRFNFIGGLYLQPELLFTDSQASLTVDQGGVDPSQVKFGFNRIDIPFLIGGKLGPVRLNAGPAFSFLTNAEQEGLTGVAQDIKDNYEDFTLGYQAGAGIDLLRFMIDLKYESHLSTFGESIAGFSTDQRQSQWILAVGFKLIKGN